jgi:hypothetical protein
MLKLDANSRHFSGIYIFVRFYYFSTLLTGDDHFNFTALMHMQGVSELNDRTSGMNSSFREMKKSL